ncbi:hypothetical protein ABAC460_02275 [Asticcacaulis sp. AC460]|uniref:NYN domain-containing protein n=1 Tax=Asticcacaulis sp. AC460 TaxID=1282360 RepID=UPI0003C3D904|nr:NYN domain-containing protein [Asticcacaulis sp. AC460]ESQ93105.1 hypothetical protein ABAC460_02275 [Asticcacaulis sp. AC460]
MMPKLALLIDGDNIGPQLIAPLWKHVVSIGMPNVQRVYRDWSRGPDWKEVLLKYALQPVHQFNYAPGKNATDIAMVIDALDLAQTELYDGFCLASSDSDFTPLAIRLRQRGLKVYGFGEGKTPTAFQQACDRFIILTSPPKTKVA